jgi:serine acetyltransferase
LWPVRGTLSVSCAAARRWWWLQQLQWPFNHLVIFESLLRLVPGLYQSWLWLWGGNVSLFSMIGPGVIITDRQMIRIGRGAILGNGCLIGGHLVVNGPTGWEIIVAEVTIESGALVGARALLGPGSSIAAGEQIPATLPLPPFQRWQDGRRQKVVNND